jgi:uncharacterized RDD family membrane protein YckC
VAPVPLTGPPPGGPGRPGYQYPPGYPYPTAGRPSTRAVTTPDGVPLAGAGWRLLARVIDGLLVQAVSMAVGFPFVRQMFDTMLSYLDKIDQAAQNGTQVNPFELYTLPGYWSAAVGLMVIQIAISGIYHTTFIALRGATLGKLAAGVRVRPWAAEGRPTWGQAALRWLTTDIASILAFIGGGLYGLADDLWLLWDDKRQCLHDKLPKTSVVKAR